MFISSINKMIKITFSVQTGKPGSVCDDHLSRRNISNTFKPSPKARGPRYAFPRRCSGWGLQGRYVSTSPVSSYLAFSSLPFRAVFFSVALSLKLPSPGTARHPVLWSPDFPHAPCFRTVGARDRLGLPRKHNYSINKLGQSIDDTSLL